MANLHGGLVVGTENKSENYVGYATKYGDAACDISMIDDLTKTEIAVMAEYLDIPEGIRTKKPSADLWADQTDEDELGFTYEELDKWILQIDEASTHAAKVVKMDYMHTSTRHKFETYNLWTINSSADDHQFLKMLAAITKPEELAFVLKTSSADSDTIIAKFMAVSPLLEDTKWLIYQKAIESSLTRTFGGRHSGC